jgi:hypothetical protein
MNRLPLRWGSSRRHTSIYARVLRDFVATPALQEFSQTLDPVKIGPSQIKALWNVIDGHFAVPENWEEVGRNSWVQGTRVGTSRRPHVKCYTIDEFVGNIRLRGLLDEVEFSFEQTLRRKDGTATRTRSLSLTLPLKGRPEISLVGDPLWINQVNDTLETFFENERSHPTIKRTAVILAPVTATVVLAVAVALRYGFAAGFILGLLGFLAAFVVLNAIADKMIPDSRIYVDESTGKPSILYTWAEGIAIGVASGVIVAALIWAAPYL